MKHYVNATLGLVLLLAAGGCSNMPHFGSQSSNAKPAPTQQAAAPNYSNQTYASNTGDCSTLANQRMAMFDRPDTYPISDAQKHEAYQALYTECVNGNTGQVAAASHNNVPYNVANNASAAQFANLSPAAGGYAPHAAATPVNGQYISSSQVPGATVVVIGGNGNTNTAAQLSSLSPSSGGTATSPNATVVLVQSPTQAAAPANGYYSSTTPAYYPAGTPLPVAVPVPPAQTQGYLPASQTVASNAPRQTPRDQPVQAQYQRQSPQQPSLASADATAAGTGSLPANSPANQQLVNVLEK